MTKENSLIKIWIGLAIVIFLSYALVMNVSASARDGRSDRTDTSRGEETSPAPDPEPTLPKFPKPSQGGITSDTNGSVNTGGNSGGNVTTGDELLEVIEINIGPTNPRLRLHQSQTAKAIGATRKNAGRKTPDEIVNR